MRQSGSVSTVFSRPASGDAAWLAGAEVIGEGRILEDGTIDIGRNVHLQVAGPALVPGSRVGWAMRPYQLRLGRNGIYPATVLSREPVRGGHRRVTVRFGDTALTRSVDPTCPSEGPRRASVDPEVLQVWPG